MKTRFFKQACLWLALTLYASTMPFAQNWNGTWTIASKATGKRLDGDQTQVYPHDPNGGDNQKWVIKKQGGNAVTITNKATGKCLVGWSGQLALETPQANNTNQYWRIVEAVSPGHWNITNYNNNKRLDGDANTLYLHDANNGDYQQWRILSANGLVGPAPLLPRKLANNLPSTTAKDVVKFFSEPAKPANAYIRAYDCGAHKRFFMQEIKSMSIKKGYTVVLFSEVDFSGTAYSFSNESQPSGYSLDNLPSDIHLAQSWLVFPSAAMVLFSEPDYQGSWYCVDMKANKPFDNPAIFYETPVGFPSKIGSVRHMGLGKCLELYDSNKAEPRTPCHNTKNFGYDRPTPFVKIDSLGCLSCNPEK